MKKKAGLWIDHRKAVIVFISDQGEEIKEITSNLEQHVRFTGKPGSDTGSTEDMRDRQFDNHLNSYYDSIVDSLRGVDSIQIFGPGVAKGELKKRLEKTELKGHILAVETADKMTVRQVSAKVRELFPS
jgi:hypothetical protein